jgi:hypothetical protein
VTVHEAAYHQAIVQVAEIADDDYRAAATEGIVLRRLLIERCQPDSAVALRLRSEARSILTNPTPKTGIEAL